MSDEILPSVNRLEQEISAKNYELACLELIKILTKLDCNFGGIEGIQFDYPKQLSDL